MPVAPQSLPAQRGLWERRIILITKEKKSKQLAELTEMLSKSKAVVFTEYKGLTVAQISELRKSLKEAGAEYKVFKNTLVSIAAKGTPYESAKSVLSGPTGLAFGYDDPIAAAKKPSNLPVKTTSLRLRAELLKENSIQRMRSKRSPNCHRRQFSLAYLQERSKLRL